jgi:hypothetical protein
MEIRWHKNPLRTTYVLTDAEKAAFRLKITLELLEEAMADAVFHLDVGESRQYYDPHVALQRLQEALPGDDDKEPVRVQQQYEMLLDELENGSHHGDCTCFNASCAKCRAEQILGCDSIEGLGKHSARQIDGSFGPDCERSIDGAIEKLAVYEPLRTGSWLNYPEEDFTAYVPGWKAQAKAAHEWLVAYRAAHFS